MRGNSDLSETYPFSVAPANGWGNPNPTDEFIIVNGSVLNKGVDVGGGDFTVDYKDATRFPDATSAAIASGKVAEQYRSINKLAA